MIFISEVIFLTELIKYYLVLDKVLYIRTKRQWLMVAAGLIFSILLVLGVTDGSMFLWFYTFCVWVVMVLISDVPLKKLFIHLIMMELVFLSISSFIALILNGIYKSVYENIDGDRHVYYLIANIMTIIGSFMLQFIRSKRGKVKIEKLIDKKTAYAIIVFVFLTISFVITLLNKVWEEIEIDSIRNAISVTAVIGRVAVIMLAILLYHIYKTSEWLEDSYRKEKELKEMQRFYYESALERESETRKFRHDIAGHMEMVEYFLRHRNYDEAGKYLSRLNIRISELCSHKYDVGNEIMNGILASYAGKLDEEVEVDICGEMGTDLKIDDYDLCTVFSNLLSNAVEELKDGSFEKPYLMVKITKLGNGVEVSIKNSSREKVVEKCNVETTKKDKRVHGIGLQNVRRTLEKNDGVLSLDYYNGAFTAKVFLPF